MRRKLKRVSATIAVMVFTTQIINLNSVRADKYTSDISNLCDLP